MNKHLIRSKVTGRFISVAHARRLKTMRSKSKKVVNGRLYNFKGTVVRALRKENDKRLVGVHKRLFGYVNDSELGFITQKTVRQYLKKS
jgi:hypothetical protein|tara:strand:- start:924 stop:1190 length:267 start_codon:yes stop_codon:yes gene_type:complete